MKTGICKLCEQEKELINKSHIIPRQFHHHTTNEIKKYFDDVSLNEAAYIYSKYGQERQFQCGLYVGEILCRDCENFIGEWDNYAQNLLLKQINIDPISVKQEITKQIQPIENVNYKLLKLFFMSVLWRSHLAKDNYFLTKNTKNGEIKEGQIFKEVNLGEQWETKLRKMLLQKNPGTEYDFSVFLIKYIGKESCIHLLPPWKSNNDAINFYNFTFAGYSFFIKVDQRNFPNKINEFILKPNAPLYFPIKEYKESPDYFHLLKWVNSVPDKSV